MNSNNFKKIINQRGLTLMETTIGLGILMIGVMASLTVMFSSFKYTQQSEYEIVVVNLAREGIEIVRSMRNNEDDNDPNDFNIFDLTENTKYKLDIEDDNSMSNIEQKKISDSSVTSVSNCDSCQLYFKNGKYVHDSNGSTPTIFKRLIKIENTNPNKSFAKKVISEVSWTAKNRTYSYTLETYLYDWQ